MGRFIIRRLLLTILVIVGAAIIIFVVMFFVPGNPAELLLGPTATPADIAVMEAKLGLDKPFLVQLGDFLYNSFLRFDFGDSWTRGTSVISGLIDRLPRTLLLGFLTSLVSVVLGIPLGVAAATHHGGWQDKGLIVGSMVFISVPEFWLALMLILVFSQQLGLLPSMGIESWKCYILPIVSGSVSGICNIARQSRASVLDVVRADFITTARAKGMKERAIIYKHMLPNALIPIITICGNYFARCIGGTIVIEKIFSFPGIGLYLNDAISMRDYPVVRGCVIIMAAFTALIMLLVDLAYGFADPRIKSQYADSSKKKGNIPGREKRRRPGRGEHRRSGESRDRHSGGPRGYSQKRAGKPAEKAEISEHCEGGIGNDGQ